jgi:hypothetical protein
LTPFACWRGYRRPRTRAACVPPARRRGATRGAGSSHVARSRAHARPALARACTRALWASLALIGAKSARLAGDGVPASKPSTHTACRVSARVCTPSLTHPAPRACTLARAAGRGAVQQRRADGGGDCTARC